MTLWIIDDEKDLLEIFGCFLDDYNVDYVLVDHFSKCNPAVGDKVIHDLCGVGEIVKVPSVKYFSYSGSVHPNVYVDFRKPQPIDEIIEAVLSA